MLKILIGNIILSYIIGCIVAVLIGNHIESYCKKIGIDIGEAEPKSIFGFPVPKTEKRETLDKHTQNLSYIYAVIVFVILLFVYYG